MKGNFLKLVIRPTMYATIAVILLAVTNLAFGDIHMFKKGNRPVEENTWVGFKESELVSQFGYPDQIQDRYVQIGRRSRPIPSGLIRTLIYLHDSGSLYLWLNKVNEDWKCFASLWFDKDVQF